QNMFVTCLYAVLDPATGAMRYANAGHDLPFVRRGHDVTELRATGMPLGAMPGMQYEEKEATLAPGDVLLLHSDGVAEAHDAGHQMFGFPRMRKLFGDLGSGHELIDGLLESLTTSPARPGSKRTTSRSSRSPAPRDSVANASSRSSRSPRRRATSGGSWTGSRPRPPSSASTRSASSGSRPRSPRPR